MKLVNIEASHDSIGQIIDVEITEAKSFSLNGKKKPSFYFCYNEIRVFRSITN